MGKLNDTMFWPIVVISVIGVGILLMGPFVFSQPFEKEIVVTGKEVAGSEQMYIISGDIRFVVPGYMWNDIKIGSSYKISGSKTWLFVEYKVNSITEIP